jgi:glycerol-3-phosphate dehydrogenase
MKYDLVVLGAGIQGAGIAQAAAAAGYSVAVLEKTAPAAGTSSKSSKLIHGGLRYLETMQLGLVRESLQERALLLKLAPDLVKMQPLHIPIYEDSKRSPLMIRAGLSMYAFLASLNANSLFKQLPPAEWNNLEGLKQEKLKAVFRYNEAQTDDAALTRAVLHSAIQLGAEVLMPATFIGADINYNGCEIEFIHENKTQTINCDILINATGPWVRDVISKIKPQQQLPNIDLVQGSHLLLPPLLQQYFYLEAPQDKRAVFVLPWKGKLMLGTTEKIHTDVPEAAACSQQEREYLLQVLQHYFPTLNIPNEGIDSFAGLRVLPKSGQSAFSRSREVIFDVDNQDRPRVLSVMGGKLTTYRATAQQVMARLANVLPTKQRRVDTALISLLSVD